MFVELDQCQRALEWLGGLLRRASTASLMCVRSRRASSGVQSKFSREQVGAGRRDRSQLDEDAIVVVVRWALATTGKSRVPGVVVANVRSGIR